MVLRDGAREHIVRVSGAGPYRVGEHVLVRDRSEPHAWTVDRIRAAAAMDTTRAWVTGSGRAFELETAPPERLVDVARAREVDAPMPGVVIAVYAKPEQRVRRGDLLFALEAMKMELRVEAPADGMVKAVNASVGQTVTRGQRLADFDPDPS